MRLKSFELLIRSAQSPGHTHTHTIATERDKMESDGPWAYAQVHWDCVFFVVDVINKYCN